MSVTKTTTRLRLSTQAKIVLRARYLAKNMAGMIVETPKQLFWRVATDVAQAERLYPATGRLPHSTQRWYECMDRLDFLPNSPTLMHAGRRLQQLPACFVLPVEDSLASIYDTLKHQALIHQSGGGTGFSFSHVRLIAGCSPDIEPLYGVQEVRRVIDGIVLTSIHPAFLLHAHELSLDIDSLRPDLTASPSIQHVTQIPEHLRRLFVTAHDVSPAQHVRMQSVFQRYSGSGVSKPINMPAPRPKPKRPKPFFSRTDSNAKVSPSSDQAAENSSCSPMQPC
jgi:ribonucleotide reductase alpha subunit